MKKLLLPLFLLSFLLASCGGDEAPVEDAAAQAETDKDAAPKKGKKKGKKDAASLAAEAAAKQAKRDQEELAQQQGAIVVLGDSLSADEGLASDQGWTGLLRKRLSTASPAIPVVNASISGDTASGGAGRIAWQLGKYHPRLVVLALGSRDIAANTPVHLIRPSLETVILTSQANGVPVVLVGVHAPTSAPQAYQQEVDAMYADLAKKYSLPFVPDLVAPLTRANLAASVDGSGRDQTLAQAQPAIMETVWPAVQEAMKQSGALPAPSP